MKTPIMILASLAILNCTPTEPNNRRDPNFIGDRTTKNKEIHEGVLTEDDIFNVYLLIRLDTIYKGSEITLAVGNDIILHEYGFVVRNNTIFINRKDKYLNEIYKLVIYSNKGVK